MDSDPPLNLTSVKVESANKSASHQTMETDPANTTDKDYIFVQTDVHNQNQLMTITGEVVDDDNSAECKKSSNEADEPSEYQCPICSKSFSRASRLRTHQKIHTVLLEEEEENLENHEKISGQIHQNEMVNVEASVAENPQNGENSLKCRVCSKVFADHSSYATHMEAHGQLKCPHCPKVFHHQYRFNTHIRKHTGEKPYACSICSRRFKQFSHLTTHMRTHTNDRPYQCKLCPASFSQNGSLKRHVRSHTGERPYACDRCDRVFIEKRNLKRHMFTHDGIRPHKCHICPSSFTQRIDLKRHLHSHAGTKPFVCSICKSAFSRKSNLKWHMGTHVGDTPYECPVCKAGFREMRDLKTHKRLHENKKKHNCSYCDLSFSSLPQLKKHSLCHKTDKCIPCAICGMNLLDQTALDKHLKAHGDTKSFECQTCGLTCEDPHVFQKHASTHPDQVLFNSNVASMTPKVSSESNIQSTKSSSENSHDGSNIAGEPKPGNEIYLYENVNGVMSFYLQKGNQPPKLGKPVGGCPNHQDHVQFSGRSSGNFAPVCFCDVPQALTNVEAIPSHSNSFFETSATPTDHQQVYDYSSSMYPQTSEVKNTEPPMYARDVQEMIAEQTFVNHSFTTNEFSPVISSFPEYLPQCQEEIRSAPKVESHVTLEIEAAHDSKPHASTGRVDESKISFNAEIVDNLAPCAKLGEIPLSTYRKEQTGVLEQVHSTIISSELTPPLDRQDPACFSETPNPNPSNLLDYSKENNDMSVQYNLTVNNPATGEIQIAFASKNEEGSNEPISTKSSTNPKTKEYACSQCNKRFIKHKSYEAHMRTHNGKEKLYHCGLCSQSFGQCNSLMVHMRTHTGEKPYVCGLCPSAFTQSSNLRVHMRTHTGERPFKCDKCESSFSQGSHLKSHKRIHENERPYVCDICWQAFTQKSTLKRHKAKHPAIRTRKCDKCKTVFPTNDLLINHLKSEQCTAVSSEKGSAHEKSTMCTSTEEQSSSVPNHSVAGSSSEETELNRVSSMLKSPGTPSSKKSVSKSKCRPLILQPTRSSKRIREAAVKGKNSKKNEDFITGDLDEIDQVERLENQELEAKRRKDIVKESMDDWCFCETPHRPDEPHTAPHRSSSSGHDVPSKPGDMIMSQQAHPGVIQLAMSDLSHAVILQAGTAQMHGNNGTDHEELVNSNGSVTESDFTGIEKSVEIRVPEVRDVERSQNQQPSEIMMNDGRSMMSSAQIVPPSQIFSHHVLGPDGTSFIIENGELIDGAVVLNGTPAGFFLDVADDSQMMIPIQETMSTHGNTYVSYSNTNSGHDNIQNGETCDTVSVMHTMEASNSIAPIMSTSSELPEPTVSSGQEFTLHSLDNNFIELFNQENAKSINTSTASKDSPHRGSTKRRKITVVPIKCPVCPKEFAQKCRLVKHLDEEHPEIMACKICYEPCYSAENLSAHKETHRLFCNDCGSTFKTKGSLQKHRNSVHLGNIAGKKKEKNTKIACPKCPSSFYQQSDLKRHLSSHDGVKSFTCDFCGFAFTRKSSMKKHRRIHTGEKPYTCSDCKLDFKYRYQYNRHIKIHSSDL